MVGHFQEFEDEYLEMMYEFHEAEPGGIVRTGDLAAKLDVSPASATEMVQRLAVRAGPSDGTAATQSMSALSRSMDMRMLRSSISGRSMESLPAGALSNDMESQRLSRRIMELEAQLNMKDLELSRAKAMLESIAGSSEKTVKEVDVIQRKNSQQLMELQGMLNKSEQARRELEIQISNGTAREEEFQLAFSRAKEQTEAREVYSTPQSLYARTHVYMDKIHYMCT